MHESAAQETIGAQMTADMSSSEVTRQQEIEDVSFGRPHVFILGAGASIAALPQGDRNGTELPDMRGLAQVAEVRDLLAEAGFSEPVEDFEAAYAAIHSDDSKAEIATRMNAAVRDFFQAVELVDEPTIYDHLILSLREKDLIATFNWDPLLMQAYLRLQQLGVTQLPRLAFLHGNVAIGVCMKDRVGGLLGARCSKCGEFFADVPLLYPVSKKNYEADEFIASEWQALRHYLEHAALVTIFGYRAPKSDVAAIAEFKKAWGTAEEREFEQFEIIGRPGADHERLRATWDDFIHTHHYDVFENYFDSFAAKHPRRSGEAFFNQYLAAKFIDENPAPQGLDLGQTVDWYRELMSHEGATEKPDSPN